MGYRIKQQTLSGLEATGGHNLVVVEVDAVADFASLPTYQDGSVGYIRGNLDALYIKDTTWKLIDKSALAEGQQIEIDGINPFALMMTFKLLQGKLATLATAAQLASTAMQPDEEQSRYYKLDALPTTTAELFEGKIVYNRTDHTLQVCTTPGEHESDTLTVTAGAVTTGNITITLNGEAVVVAVAEEDTAAQVAAKIKAAVDAAVVAETIAAWTAAIDGAELNFLKAVVGVCVAPTAVDTGETGVTFSAFARTNEGVASVWGTLINAS